MRPARPPRTDEARPNVTMSRVSDSFRGVADRRARRDRRARHVLFTDWRWAYAGRRVAGRRSSERALTGVDRYGAGLGALAVAIFVLSCMDAAFTLAIVFGNLGVELNPFMRAVMQYDAQTFVNLKIVLTGAGITFLVVLADAPFLRWIRVRTLMYTLLAMYAAIVGYEIINLGILG